MDQQQKKSRRAHSHLFTLRFWFEWKDEEQKELRGQAAHVLSGKAAYFRDWSALVSFLEESLAGLEEEHIPTDGEQPKNPRDRPLGQA